MQFAERFKQDIYSLNQDSFEAASLELFYYQYHTCEIYHQYCNFLNKNPTNTQHIFQVPFLPIEFFKTHVIKTGDWAEQKVFKSSGTTGSERSLHFVQDLDHYHSLTKVHFEQTFGELKNFQLLALLPSYQEQNDSSLIEMVDHFMTMTLPGSNYFLDDQENLIQALRNITIPKILFGVSYALLDLADAYPNESFENVLIFETGGMKGRKKEITRSELHERLKTAFGVSEIASEYGMTELMSQAYAKNGVFSLPNWAKMLIRDINDPFSYLADGKTGGINIIDLGNVDSCAFIETKDLGKKKGELFEVLGRFDNSDVRGCNLLI